MLRIRVACSRRWRESPPPGPARTQRAFAVGQRGLSSVGIGRPPRPPLQPLIGEPVAAVVGVAGAGRALDLLAAQDRPDAGQQFAQAGGLGQAVVGAASTPEDFAAFEAAVLALKDVLDYNLVAGDFDYLLKIRVRDMADFNKLHGQTLIALPGVRQTRTFFVMKEVKDGGPLPF